MRVGVLAVQGGVAPHVEMLRRLGYEAVLLRRPKDFVELEGLVLPGGESTTQRMLIDRLELFGPLDAVVTSGVPVLATCAGLILAAQFGWLDVTVLRNGWGRQRASFEARDDSGNFDLTFIRAPRITSVGGDVEVLATFDEEAVLVRQGRMIGATFHPELTDHTAVHQMVFQDDISVAQGCPSGARSRQ